MQELITDFHLESKSATLPHNFVIAATHLKEFLISSSFQTSHFFIAANPTFTSFFFLNAAKLTWCNCHNPVTTKRQVWFPVRTLENALMPILDAQQS